MKTFQQQRSPDLNIILERICRTRADMFLQLGEPEQAHDALMSLATDLAQSGVKPSVVAQITNDAAGIELPKRKRPARKTAGGARKKPARRR
jgi:hypothetical protein